MKKILIISHLPISKETNVGKTLYNLFCNYPKSCLFQVFFTLEGIVFDCKSSFYISDHDVLKSFLHHTKNCGRVFDYNEECKADNNKASLIRLNKRSSLSLLLRDFCWKKSNYFNKGFSDWINSIQPDLVFLAPGYSRFPYQMAKSVCEKLRIPLYTYYMEDFYDAKHFTISPLFWFRLSLFRRTVRKNIDCSSKLFALNEGLALHYAYTFKKEFKILFNPSLEVFPPAHFSKEKVVLVYAGSINRSREFAINKIGETIVKNKLNGFAEFIVCGPCQTQKIMDRIIGNSGISYKGYLDSVSLYEEIKKADVVVHVESFKSKNVAKTKLALSTKIPEYLVSNRIILAIGPSSIESVRYLSENKCAFVICKKNMIENQIIHLLNNLSDYAYLTENAMKLAEKNHSIDCIQEKLYKEIDNDD